MTLKEIPFDIERSGFAGEDLDALRRALALRAEAEALYGEGKFDAALEKTVGALREMRGLPDFSQHEFRLLLTVLLFDLAEIHFSLRDFRQSEKELEFLFKVLEPLMKEDADRFGPYHLLAMDLSTRILRSRKKTLDLLAKQQINTGVLYEKVNAGVAAASDKLVDSLRKGAEMMAQTGDYRGAVRFYMEAIKLAKKRSGRVGRREIRMTVDMARVMMHSRSEAARAKRLLEAVLPHAVSLEILELEEEILALTAKIDEDAAHESKWHSFVEKIQETAKSRFGRRKQ